MKRGILGGSFNPPHKLHLEQAKALLKNDIVDKVVFVPNIRNPYHNKNLVDPIHRYKMVELMIKDHHNMEISDVEYKKEQQNFMYQTLDEMKSIYPDDEIMLIIGSDNLKELHHWKGYEYILNTYRIIVTKRGYDNIELIFKDNPYLENYRHHIIIFDNLECSELSSTLIRNLLADNKDINSHVTKDVYQYIIDNNLYVKEDK